MPGPKVDGYVLSPEDMTKIKQLLYNYRHQFVNPRLQDTDRFLDYETNTNEIYIARTPATGIPAMGTAGSSGTGTGTGTAGEGDSPGKADCHIYRITRSAELIDPILLFTKPVYNLSFTAFPPNRFIVIVKDKYGSWLAIWPGIQRVYRDECYGGFLFRAFTEDDGDTWELDEYLGVECDTGTGTGSGTGTAVPPDVVSSDGPGWVAGLSDEDCLQLEVLSASGKCSTIDTTQLLTLISDDGSTWVSTTDFEYNGGSGPVVFSRSTPSPTLSINGYGGILHKARSGIGISYIDYMFGGVICSDSGTGSGTGGARDACGGNTFTVRLTCTDCPVTEVDACCPDPLPVTLYADLSDGYGTVTLEWNGVDYWEGSLALSCGDTLYLRFDIDCALQYSCDGVSYAPTIRECPGSLGTSALICHDCGPPYQSEVPWTLSLAFGGNCNNCLITITATIRE